MFRLVKLSALGRASESGTFTSRSLKLVHAGIIAQCSAMSKQLPAPLSYGSDLNPRAKNILDYWFGEGFASAEFGDAAKERQKIWYRGGPEVDGEIKERFGGDIEALKAGGLQDWVEAYELLAAIILADQFTRNAFRGSADMYFLDDVALQCTDKLLAHEDWERMQPIAQVFALMPLMHSESVSRHEQMRSIIEERLEALRSMAGYETIAAPLADQLKFLDGHTDVIRKWGRYPHRNQILGRPDTPAEKKGKEDGSIAAW